MFTRRHFLAGFAAALTAPSVWSKSGRSRAAGWRHAKRTGHQNEDRIEDLLAKDEAFRERFLARIGRPGRRIASIGGGGLGERHVPSVLASGAPTTPKTDMYVAFDDGSVARFSIKKSLGGQVYLVTVENFIEAYERHYAKVPDEVQKAMRLYWGTAPETAALIEEFGTCKDYERHKRRLTAESIRRYDHGLTTALLEWFKESAYNVADLCFARGAAKNPSDWAEYVWYKNELHETPVDEIFKISDICSATKRFADEKTSFGKRNGGSTVQFPFGFVQWHSPQGTFPGSMQFHHSYRLISEITSRKT